MKGFVKQPDSPNQYRLSKWGFSLFLSLFFFSANVFASSSQPPCYPPVANFIQASANLIVQFQDQSTNAPTVWSWDFGDGATSTLGSPSHTYSSAGTYSVCLRIQNDCGADSICKQVQVGCSTPNPSFQDTTNGLSVSFSAPANNGAMLQLWDFGDGQFSFFSNPTHTYATPGSYTACHIVRNACGSDTLCRTVNAICPLIVSAFSDSAGSNGLTVYFRDSSQGKANRWYWDFGDGSSSLSPFPTHVYTQPGTYQVCLKIENNCSADSICKQIVIQCPGPAPTYGFSVQQNVVSFQSQMATTYNYLKWDFGDGQFSFAQNPTHIYNASGVFNVCLVAGSICGKDTFCRQVAINCPRPGAAFQDSTVGLAHKFKDLSSGQPVSWLWDFGDGTTSTQRNPNHFYANTGTYSVCLIVNNVCGKDTFCRQVTFSCAPPVSSFGALNTSGLMVQLAQQSTGNISRYYWDLGDGNFSVNPQLNYTYQQAGYYRICLTTTSACGSSTFCRYVVVGCQASLANFQFAGNGTTVSFADGSLGGVQSWKWDFGDGMGSTLQNPVHQYSAPGMYQVCLISDNGCKPDTICKFVQVSCALPVADYRFVGGGLNFQFFDQSSQGILHYDWDFGDGTTSKLKDPVHSFLVPGSYPVCLVVSSSCGSDTFCLSVQASCSAPETRFNYKFLNQKVYFTDISSQSPNSWFWDFGDGSSSTLQNPSHEYMQSGIYQVCLISENICGSDTFCQEIQVLLTGQFPAASAFLEVFPNPASGLVTVRSDGRIDALALSDLSGRLVRSLDGLQGASVQLDLADLARGTYVLRISSRSGHSHQLLILD